jgi:thioredoxin 1
MSGAIKEITDSEFRKAISSGKVLVDFWAPWCGPCQLQTPIIEELAAEVGDTAVIAKMNVDENNEAATNLGIQSIPTIVVFKDGVEVKRFVGVQQKEALMAALEGSN